MARRQYCSYTTGTTMIPRRARPGYTAAARRHIDAARLRQKRYSATEAPRRARTRMGQLVLRCRHARPCTSQLPPRVEKEVVVDELPAAAVNGESDPGDQRRSGDAQETTSTATHPGAQRPPAARQRPEPESQERPRKNEQHLLRAHDGGPEAEPAAQEPAQAAARRSSSREQPAQQEPERAEEEQQGRHVGTDLQGLLDEHRLPREKQPRQKTHPAIGDRGVRRE